MKISISATKKQQNIAKLLFGAKHQTILKQLEKYSKEKLFDTTQIDLFLNALKNMDEAQAEKLKTSVSGKKVLANFKAVAVAKSFDQIIKSVKIAKCPKALQNSSTPVGGRKTAKLPESWKIRLDNSTQLTLVISAFSYKSSSVGSEWGYKLTLGDKSTPNMGCKFIQHKGSIFDQTKESITADAVKWLSVPKNLKALRTAFDKHTAHEATRGEIDAISNMSEAERHSFERGRGNKFKVTYQAAVNYPDTPVHTYVTYVAKRPTKADVMKMALRSGHQPGEPLGPYKVEHL